MRSQNDLAPTREDSVRPRQVRLSQGRARESPVGPFNEVMSMPVPTPTLLHRLNEVEALFTLQYQRSDMTQVMHPNAINHVKEHWVPLSRGVVTGEIEQLRATLFPQRMEAFASRTTIRSRKTWINNSDGHLTIHIAYGHPGNPSCQFIEQFFMQWASSADGTHCLLASAELMAQRTLGFEAWPPFQFLQGIGGYWRHPTLLAWLWDKVAARVPQSVASPHGKALTPNRFPSSGNHAPAQPPDQEVSSPEPHRPSPGEAWRNFDEDGFDEHGFNEDYGEWKPK